ncbi:helix-turn-helix domain-containing protein, partial [Zoogloea sp.]|uniref:helix-turn-helix domain-containing protein n=1 Tax=Zoogloea sp. TaxID=49181 RepID=UPI0014158AC4
MTTECCDEPRQNRILAALPPDEYARLVDGLEYSCLPAGRVVFGSGDNLEFVYFPTSCIFSLISTLADGYSVELAMTGNDGLVGIPLVLGAETSQYKVVVQSAGGAYRLRAESMCWALEQPDASLRRLSLCYTQALMTEMAQSVLCNRHHSVVQQLCRWLLLRLDQISGSELDVTQEMISGLLGVRREGVTEAAGKLQAAGLIQYRRGHIAVTDRAGLEARACECYHAVRTEHARLFRGMTAPLAPQRSRSDPLTLRQRAETRLKQVQPVSPGSQWDTALLLHELRVHQVELEMHNEELRQAYDEVDALRERYADLYDFAPVGYFTLNAQGVIMQLNLAGAILLGVKRSQLGRSRFAAHVKPAFLPEFNAFVDEVLSGKARSKCEIALMATERRPELLIRIEAVADEEGRECRMVVMEVAEDRSQAGGREPGEVCVQSRLRGLKVIS